MSAGNENQGRLTAIATFNRHWLARLVQHQVPHALLTSGQKVGSLVSPRDRNVALPKAVLLGPLLWNLKVKSKNSVGCDFSRERAS
jgi:hypothetical protein